MGLVRLCASSVVECNIKATAKLNGSVNAVLACGFTFIVTLCIADVSGIQYRVLNKSKGPAVWVRLLK